MMLGLPLSCATVAADVCSFRCFSCSCSCSLSGSCARCSYLTLAGQVATTEGWGTAPRGGTCKPPRGPTQFEGGASPHEDSIARRRMRKKRKITTMDTQERYFQNSLGHPSLPTALFFLADSRALIRSTVFCCEDSLHFSWLKPLGRRPCRESGPPQSLHLGPGPKVRRESGQPQSLQSSQDRLP